MTYLRKVTIENYRGFSNKQIASFARPSGEKGSGLTIIVGPNNSGKTSVIEALTITTSKKINKGERHQKDPKIIIESDTETSIFTNIDSGSQIKLSESSFQHTITFDVISSRRHWDSSANGANYTPQQFTQTSTTQEVRGKNSSLEVATLLRSINKNPTQKLQLIKLVKTINKNFTFWTIDTDDSGRDYVKYITNNGQTHRTDFLGDGLISIIRICAHLLAEENGKVLIIDEPELSLHPAGQKALSKILSEISVNRQVIVCTHSPHFINFQDFLNGAEIIRLNKKNDEECIVSQLDHGKEYDKKLIKLDQDWYKPYLVDYVAKEILFYERVLFVEGQEDVALIKKYLKEKNIEFKFEIFGYGVGGYGNMELFLSLAQDLRLEKTVALFDKKTPNFESLKKSFESDELKLYEIDTDDIRDKLDKSKLIKIGVFDSSGKLKNTKEAKNFEDLLKKIIDFLES